MVVHNRLVYKGQRLDGTGYKRCIKTNNTVVQLSEGKFGEIIQICTSTHSEVMLLVKLFNVHHNKAIANTPHITCISRSEHKCVVLPSDIVGKCLLLEFSDKMYICTFPNNHEKDEN